MSTFVKPFFVLLLLWGLSVAVLPNRAVAQLSVGPSGIAPQTFDSAPPVSEWSTFSVGPVAAGGVISTDAQMDNVVQTNAAARVNLALPVSSTVPPSASRPSLALPASLLATGLSKS